MPATTERHYELVLMLDPETPDDQREKIATDARARIESDGALKHNETWGLRKMAFDIDQRTEADYRFYRFVGEKPLLDALDHNLKITDGVLRFRIFRVDPRSPLITPPDPSIMAARPPRGRGDRRDDDDDGDFDPGIELDKPPAAPPAPPAAPPAAEAEPAEAVPAEAEPEPAAEAELAEAPADEPEVPEAPADEPEAEPAEAPAAPEES